jgi:hypothetical protein
MNTHQKLFLGLVTTMGCMAMAFAAPAERTAPLAEVTLPVAMVVGHRHAMEQEVVFDQVTVIGHRSELMASSTTPGSNG